MKWQGCQAWHSDIKKSPYGKMIRLCHYAAYLIEIYCTSPLVQCFSKATESYESYLQWYVRAKEAFAQRLATDTSAECVAARSSARPPLAR